MPIVKFTQPAEFDLQLIENYIAYELQNPQAADDTIDGISEEAEKLATFPEKHQFVSDPVLARLGFRMTWYGNYNIFYIYDEFEEIVHIIRVLYDKQDWRTILKR